MRGDMQIFNTMVEFKEFFAKSKAAIEESAVDIRASIEANTLDGRPLSK